MTAILLKNRISPLARLNQMLGSRAYNNSRFFILVDKNTYSNCLPLLISKVSRLQEAEFFEVPAGEEAKSIEIASQLWFSLLDSQADRHSVIVNLGGGSVSDLGGFVAAGYKRGIRYINIPTSLIGMADAAIGGKTGINLADCKNSVGFFHNPDITCIEPDFLETLPHHELLSGIFELLKTLIISSPKLYTQFCDKLSGGTINLTDLPISHCVQFKQAVAKTDPKEAGIRLILNFGHTFGHAIESFSHQQSKPYSHGISVGLGMLCALYLSTKKTGLPESVLTAYLQLLQTLLPNQMPVYSLADTEQILSFMRNDKKNANDEILCVLLQEPGAPIINVSITENEVRDTLLSLFKSAKTATPRKK